jgi:hypothetical protein
MSDAISSLPDRIEQSAHALTAAELAELLAVSRITVFKLARRRDASPCSGLALASGSIRKLWQHGCERCSTLPVVLENTSQAVHQTPLFLFGMQCPYSLVVSRQQ